MPNELPWANAGTETSIADLLSDPVALALMQADGVVVRDVLTMIEQLCAAQNTILPIRQAPHNSAIACSGMRGGPHDRLATTDSKDAP